MFYLAYQQFPHIGKLSNLKNIFCKNSNIELLRNKNSSELYFAKDKIEFDKEKIQEYYNYYGVEWFIDDSNYRLIKLESDLAGAGHGEGGRIHTC